MILFKQHNIIYILSLCGIHASTSLLHCLHSLTNERKSYESVEQRKSCSTKTGRLTRFRQKFRDFPLPPDQSWVSFPFSKYLHRISSLNIDLKNEHFQQSSLGKYVKLKYFRLTYQVDRPILGLPTFHQNYIKSFEPTIKIDRPMRYSHIY